ncbi:ester cyclase [Flavobacterium franklandianum]|uniref:ester cyclase n=1 Tax=Flavobacterium franklandianum TaxID=2594430 RepID=UPI00117A8747|nr:ester cyclase [Flavobacterium franklandianum]TRX24807.1 ester cyclase [Flavobacterium franklandianum]
MKNLFILGLALVFLTSCNQKQHYTQQSAEIDTYKKAIAAYEKQKWDELASYYADSAKIQMNVTKENAQTIAQNITQSKDDAKHFSSWRFNPKSVEYEMVVTDKGETWVNFWGNWEGTLKANNKTYVTPVHLTAKFIEGKIVREDGYWDNSKLMIDLQKMQPLAPKETTTTN